MTLTVDFKACLLAIKGQSNVQDLLYQLNINDQGNEYAWDRGTETTTIVKVNPQGHQLYS